MARPWYKDDCLLQGRGEGGGLLGQEESTHYAWGWKARQRAEDNFNFIFFFICTFIVMRHLEDCLQILVGNNCNKVLNRRIRAFDEEPVHKYYVTKKINSFTVLN